MLALVVSVAAGPVSVDRARRVASNFARQEGLKVLIQNKVVEVSGLTAFEEFYIFIAAEGKGFILVSKDDRVMPILAYSGDQAFVTKEMPEHVESWLRDYDSQIRFNREHGIEASAETKERWDALEKGGAKTSTHVADAVPMLMTTTWNQAKADPSNVDVRYNRHCPMHGQKHAVTGCVATAMAQVMNYWKWPAHGRGSNRYTWNSPASANSDGVAYTDHLFSYFADTMFAWDLMPNALTTTSDTATEEKAVASLMYNVGIALEMMYGSSVSSAYTCVPGRYQSSEAYPTTDVVLRKYFYYKHTTNAVFISNFTNSEWISMLKMELNSARPVIYAGSDPSGGHAFVLDGYDANSAFHVNWGWGGSYDGYYAIGELNPSAQNETGGNSTYTFNLDNKAVIGIEPAQTMAPDNGTTTITAIPNNPDYGTVSGSGTYANFSDMVTLSVSPTIGYKFKCWSDGNRDNPRYLRACGGNQTFTAIFVEDKSGDIWYYGTAESLYSFTLGNIEEWGIKLPYSQLAGANSLTRVKFWSVEGSYVVRVYQGGDAPSEDNCVYTSDTLTYTSSSDMRTHTLSSAVTIDHTNPQPIWITLSSTDGFVIFKNLTPADPDAHWFRTSSGNWTSSAECPYVILAHLSLASFPAPTSLAVSGQTTSGASLSWNAPTSMTPSGYEVAYGMGLYPESMERFSTTSTSATLSGLRENIVYDVFVRAKYRNNCAASSWVKTSFRTYDTALISDPVVVTAVPNNEGWGLVSGSGTYQSGSNVDLEAVALPGYQFEGWADGPTAASRSVAPTEDMTYTALFSRQGYPFSATSADESLGTVSLVAEDSWTSGTTTLYPYLSTVCLTATPLENNVFEKWNDGNTTNPRYCTVMQSNPTLTASFVSAGSKVSLTSRQRQLTVSVAEAATITIYDMHGRCVYRTEASSGSHNSVTLHAAGVYLVRVGSSYAEKIVIR